MFEKKEIGTIVLITLVLAVSVGFLKTTGSFPGILLAVFLVVLLNISAKKIAAYYLEAEIEMRPWQTERFGFKRDQHFKKPIPVGVFLPLLASLISWGNLYWMAALVFDVKPRVSRAAKRHGLYSFSEMTESHIGIIASVGVIVSLISAIIGYFLGFPLFARLSIYFAFFNLIPLSDLDGNKIFFGNIILWSFLSTLALIGLGYAFFLT